MQWSQSYSMIILVFLRQRVTIFPMNIHKNRLNDNSSMSMIKCFLNISTSSNFNEFLSYLKIFPLILKKVLKFSFEHSNSLIINIFIINIWSCWTPGSKIRNSNWQSWKPIRANAKFSINDFIIIIKNHNLKSIKEWGY